MGRTTRTRNPTAKIPDGDRRIVLTVEFVSNSASGQTTARPHTSRNFNRNFITQFPKNYIQFRFIIKEINL